MNPTDRKELLSAIENGPKPEAPPEALKAQKCRCEHPQTYRDEDGELRCLCGRAV